MNGKRINDFLLGKAKNVPFGIISGSLGIVAFFSVIGTVVAYAITSGMAAQTNRTATLFDNWYQTLLFVAVTVSVIGCAASLVFYCLKKRAMIESHDPKYFDCIEDERDKESKKATSPAEEIQAEAKV